MLKDESRFLFGWRGNIARILRETKELAKHSGDRDMGWFIKHPIIRLERR